MKIKFLKGNSGLWIILLCCVSVAIACKAKDKSGPIDEPGTIVIPKKEFKAIKAVDGVLKYADGEEVSLFGTNYYPMSWYQYVNMKALGVNFAEVIKRDVSDMKKMGVQVVRIHVFEREIADGTGKLVPNIALDIFDMLVHELDQQGIYLYLTGLSWWNSPIELEGNFSSKVTKMGMVFNDEAVAASEKFVTDLLNHTNTLTGRKLKNEPSLAVIEILNEPWYYPYAAMQNINSDHSWHAENNTSPEVYRQDYDKWLAMWLNYCQTNGVSASELNYNKFQKEIVKTYLNKITAVIRREGVLQPVAAALFESVYNNGVLEAIAESNVDAVTDGWYPGGFEFNENKNLFNEAGNYQLSNLLSRKARVVYEFDIPGTYNNVGMYPAMARRYRSVGAQIACHFQYDSYVTAAYNTDWGIHYLNYQYTPAKAVAFMIAAEAFSRVPRGSTFANLGDKQIFGEFAVSFSPNQAMMVTDDMVMYAHTIDTWTPFVLPTSPKVIVGRGNSNLIAYDGSGFYRLDKSSDTEMQLYISADTDVSPIDASFFNQTSLSRRVVTLVNTQHRSIKLKIPNWEKFKIKDPAGNVKTVLDGKAMVLPGKNYTITKL